jgi:aminopeptidase N
MVTATFPSALSGSYYLVASYTAQITRQPAGFFRSDNAEASIEHILNLLDDDNAILHDDPRAQEVPLTRVREIMSYVKNGGRLKAEHRNTTAKAGPQMFATQFERSSARAAFPCFDEPALKATFSAIISVISPADQYTVLFNTPLISQSYDGAQITAVFEPTIIPISSYLVAIAIGHFDYVERISDQGVPFRVYTPRGFSEYGRFALNVSIDVVDYYEHIYGFNISGMTKKLDQIAVKGLTGNAMENHGLCTYFPAFLICPPATCTLGELQTITEVRFFLLIMLFSFFSFRLSRHAADMEGCHARNRAPLVRQFDHR